MAARKNTPEVRAKSAAASSRSRLRAAHRALELAAAREADFAYRFAFNAVCASAEIKSPALRHARSSTVVRIIRQAFEEKIAGRA